MKLGAVQIGLNLSCRINVEKMPHKPFILWVNHDSPGCKQGRPGGGGSSHRDGCLDGCMDRAGPSLSDRSFFILLLYYLQGA